jgi:hypothetical protein
MRGVTVSRACCDEGLQTAAHTLQLLDLALDLFKVRFSMPLDAPDVAVSRQGQQLGDLRNRPAVTVLT